MAEIVKTAAIYAEASGGATTPKITKDHLFKATDYVTDGTVNWTISSIDTSEDAYDTLTLAGSLATTAVGTVLIQGTAGASGTTTAYYSPNGFVKEDITVGDGAALYNNADISVVVRGAVREGALPLPLTATQKTALAHFRFNA
ncbi:MAG: hypothetical protein EHM87_23320 [Burkholderiales bacterium]|nr:MAG: hypothetical protein EHM87_23320 [Burkholderiales bacterium]